MSLVANHYRRGACVVPGTLAGYRAGARHGARDRGVGMRGSAGKHGAGLFYSIVATRPIRRRRLKVRQAIGPLIGTALFVALAVIWGS